MGKQLAFVVVMVAGLAQAQSANRGEEAPWTVQSGKTVGTDQTVVWGQVGFPDAPSVQLVHGIDALTEIGGKISLDYGDHGVIDGCCHVGLDFQFLIRRNFFDNGKLWIAGTFQPGFILDFPANTTIFGLAFPLGVQFGFPVNSVLTFNGSFDLAMYCLFGTNFSTGTFALPILFGGGAEYLLQRNLALTFQLKIGPTIFTAGGSAQFTLYALAGIAYRF